jgi:hypothetical protein
LLLIDARTLFNQIYSAFSAALADRSIAGLLMASFVAWSARLSRVGEPRVA